MPAQIEVLVLPSGETRITTQGFQGTACRVATKALEAALGHKLTETLTAEYYQITREESHVVEHHDAHH